MRIMVSFSVQYLYHQYVFLLLSEFIITFLFFNFFLFFFFLFFVCIFMWMYPHGYWFLQWPEDCEAWRWSSIMVVPSVGAGMQTAGSDPYCWAISPVPGNRLFWKPVSKQHVCFNMWCLLKDRGLPAALVSPAF